MVAYESTRWLNVYLDFHYGNQDGGGLFVQRSSRESFAVRVVRYFDAGEVGRSLDLGCSVGRASFEMSRESREVIGIDFSASFIEAATTLKQENQLAYLRQIEGNVVEGVTAVLPEGVEADAVQFVQGDALQLPESVGEFDRVLAANLLCRLPDPKRLLKRLPSLVAQGGQLVMATPCSWSTEFTPREHWPEGETLAFLKEELAGHFVLERVADEAFVIREHARKFQQGVAQVSVWRKV